MFLRLYLALAAALAGMLVAGGCGSSSSPQPTGDSVTAEDVVVDKTIYKSGVTFRAKGDFFEIQKNGVWEKFYPKGVNLSVEVPGKFPGELSEDRELYDEWLDRLAELNCNVVRIYTLHHPIFYEALGEWNQAHPDTPIYLVQGIWLDELPDELDYMTDGTLQMEEETRYVIDAIHGQADIPLRYGKAFGTFRHDVSEYVMAWLPGHEMMGEQVVRSNEKWEPYTKYDGKYIRAKNGLPIEAWIARKLDLVVLYEYEKYGDQRPVGWSNWPALDPIHHPTETSRFGQDLVDVDMGQFETVPPFTAGLYVSYHVYPFNPEFIIYDPDYRATQDSTGAINSYLGYMLDLKANHQGIPLFITEFGVPSSLGVAHVNDNAWNHGGYNEDEQAEATARLVQSVEESGAAGMVIFELMDEWFKRSWMTNPTMVPPERGRLWWDTHNPEESFGMIAYYPLADWSVIIDGESSDWGDKALQMVDQGPETLAAAGDANDANRTITGVTLLADPAFLFIRIDTAGEAPPDLQNTVWVIGLSTVDGQTGDRLFPTETGLETDELGLEATLILDGANDRFDLLLDSAYDPSPRLSGRSKLGGFPEANEDGDFQLASYLINNDDQYSSSGKPYVPPKKFFVPGLLKRGNSLEITTSHFEVGPGVLEIRLPWQSICVSDPSSLQVLFDDPNVDGFPSRTTDGVQILVASMVRQGEALVTVDAAPREKLNGDTFDSDVPVYQWEGWEEVTGWVGREKPAYWSLQEAYGELP